MNWENEDYLEQVRLWILKMIDENIKKKKEKILKEIEKLEKEKKFDDEKYYLIKWEVDYADEFEYPIFSLYSWKEMNKLWNSLGYLWENDDVS